jgi:hypothetical protein
MAHLPKGATYSSNDKASECDRRRVCWAKRKNSLYVSSRLHITNAPFAGGGRGVRRKYEYGERWDCRAKLMSDFDAEMK